MPPSADTVAVYPFAALLFAEFSMLSVVLPHPVARNGRRLFRILRLGLFRPPAKFFRRCGACLLYTSDAADE